MNYKDFTLGDWIGHISGVIEDESELDGNEMRDLVEFLSKMPRWIPFSERLPKPFEHCLITTTDGEVIYHYDDGHYSKYKAWMPLPEPYKPQESEE